MANRNSMHTVGSSGANQSWQQGRVLAGARRVYGSALSHDGGASYGGGFGHGMFSARPQMRPGAGTLQANRRARTGINQAAYMGPNGNLAANAGMQQSTTGGLTTTYPGGQPPTPLQAGQFTGSTFRGLVQDRNPLAGRVNGAFGTADGDPTTTTTVPNPDLPTTPQPTTPTPTPPPTASTSYADYTGWKVNDTIGDYKVVSGTWALNPRTGQQVYVPLVQQEDGSGTAMHPYWQGHFIVGNGVVDVVGSNNPGVTAPTPPTTVAPLPVVGTTGTTAPSPTTTAPTPTAPTPTTPTPTSPTPTQPAPTTTTTTTRTNQQIRQASVGWTVGSYLPDTTGTKWQVVGGTYINGLYVPLVRQRDGSGTMIHPSWQELR